MDAEAALAATQKIQGRGPSRERHTGAGHEPRDGAPFQPPTGKVAVFSMDGLNQTTVAILAGGAGIKLRSVGGDRPKSLSTVLGKPFLAYQLEQVATAGARKIILCTGQMGEAIEALFGNRYGQLELVYSRENEPLGTAGALRLTLPLVDTENVMVMNGDSYCRTDLKMFRTWHALNRFSASILLAKVDNTSRYARVETDNARRVLHFINKGTSIGRGWVNAGVYLMSRELLSTIPANRAVSLERDLFPALVEHGLFALRTSGDFFHIDTPESYQEAERIFTKIAAHASQLSASGSQTQRKLSL